MFTIAIQAGGRSSRMGTDKGLVLLGGIPLIQHVLNRVSPLGGEVILTTNHPQEYSFLGLPMFSDPVPGAGALPGLVTALEASSNEKVLVVACDMPFLNPELLAYQVAQSAHADVVIPFAEEQFQTMHAVYSRSTCLPAIKDSLAAGKQKMIAFFETVEILTIPETIWQQYDPNGVSFFNANTPDELAQAEKILNEIG